MNPNHEREVVYRQREMMKQAENARLASMAHKPHRGYLLLARVGQKMVELGNRLQNQAEPRPIEVGRRLKPQW